MEIILANPRGFCAGVDRAIEIVDRALEIFGAPIYVRHEVVHNTFVVNCLKKKGAIFVEELDEVPDDATVIFSAHGVSQQVRQTAKDRKLKVFDATCPLVTKVHLEVARHAEKNEHVILIGHKGHPEVEGTLGQYESNNDKHIYLVENETDVEKLDINKDKNLAYVTQTTLSVDDTINIIDALKMRFANIQGPKKDDICYATQNRQDAIKQLATQCDIILVVGSVNSSNSNRLKELAQKKGISSYLIDNAQAINKHWFNNKQKIGITAGASAPEVLVQDVIKQLQHWFSAELNEDDGPKEQIVFQLPKALRSN
jgi:4-hydroxy-3-methylbut-2-enyl diphosphate reductase